MYQIKQKDYLTLDHIEMLKVEKKIHINNYVSVEQKRRIVLCHTSREVEDYLTSLSLRYNGKYDKVPHYVVKQNGEVLQLLEDDSRVDFFSIEVLNRDSIVIMLENLGWLEKKPLSQEYINWIGNIYKGKVHEKKWRDYLFWHPYTEIQVEVLAKLCSKIISDNNLPDFVVNHNTKLNEIEEMFGVISRSNISKTHTDLNPSFDFEKFKFYLDYGKLT